MVYFILLAIVSMLFLLWMVVRLIRHDRVWRVHKNGFYGDPYKAEGLED